MKTLDLLVALGGLKFLDRLSSSNSGSSLVVQLDMFSSRVQMRWRRGAPSHCMVEEGELLEMAKSRLEKKTRVGRKFSPWRLEAVTVSLIV